MRFTASLTTLALLATSSLATPISKRDTNSDAVATLESASTQMASTLTAANTQLQTLSTSADPPNGGIINTTIQNLINNFVEAIELFENIANAPSTSDASTLAQSMQTEITSLRADMADTQSQLSSSDASTSTRSVNDINELLGTLIPGVSDTFNEVADTIEALGLPSLP